MSESGDFPGRGSGGGTQSSVSGSAGDVVQARDVSGGIHFHGTIPVLSEVPAQLPADVQGFVNRDADLERLDAALGGLGRSGPERVCVIAGMAGVGKTSLAVHWAHRVRGRFPDGQLYINLRGYDPGEPVSPEQALERFLGAVGLAPAAIPAALEARAAVYRSLLAGKRMLIVLDNAATVGQVRPLLPGAGECLVLVTSRNRLSGLVARDGALRMTLEVFDEQAAVELLDATMAGYRVGDAAQDLGELARLCARLPLALRIAAERAAARPRTPLGALVNDLRDESSLWEALSADEDEEADAVRTVFAWSYRALSPDAARLFRLLGLHPGPDLSAFAAAALAKLPERRTRHLLDILVGAHLLEQTAVDRFQFHDLLRAYALDQANHQETPADRHSALERILDWYLHAADLAAAATHYQPQEPPLDLAPGEADHRTFADHDAAVLWFEAERTNLLAAIQAAAGSGFDDIAWQLPTALGGFYNYRHPFDEWFAAARIGLEAARRTGSRVGEAYLLFLLGKAHLQSGRPQQALPLLRESLAVSRTLADPLGEARSLTTGLSYAYLKLHSLVPARDSAELALATAREHGLRSHEGWSHYYLAHCCFEEGQLAEASSHIEQAVAIHHELGGVEDESDALSLVCVIQRESGHLDQALETAQHMMDLYTEHTAPVGIALVYTELGHIHLMSGRHAEALTCYQQSVVLHQHLGHHDRAALALDATGEVYQALGRPDEAVSFHRRAAATHHELGDQWHEAVALDHLATALRQADNRTAAQEAWTEALTLVDGFDGQKATSLRNSIQTALADTSG